MAGPRGRVREPIILLGAPRSGTSFLADLLAAHPDVTLLLEPRLVWRHGNDHRSDQLRREHATPAVIGHIHDRFAAALVEQGASRVVEKTPANAVRPHFVDAVFPDARYIHITRNGWASVPSMSAFWERRATGLDPRQAKKLRRRLAESDLRQLRHYVSEGARRIAGPLSRRTPLYGPRLAGLQAIVDELGRLEAAALQWRTCVEQAAGFGRSLPPERYLELRLEHLSEASILEMIDVCRLGGARAVVSRFRELYRPEEAARMRALSLDEQVRLLPYIASTNAWLGYPAGLREAARA
jgi:hypothetical protein